MENHLSSQQQEVIRRGVGFRKFAVIAGEAGCSLEDVRQFAAVLFAEKRAAEEAQEAKRKAECEAAEKTRQDHEAAFLCECKELLAAGDMAALYAAWGEEYGEEVAAYVAEANEDTRHDVVSEWMDDNEDKVTEVHEEVVAAFLDRHSDDINNTVYEDVLEAYEDEIYEAFRHEIKDEIATAMKEQFEEFVATIK